MITHSNWTLYIHICQDKYHNKNIIISSNIVCFTQKSAGQPLTLDHHHFHKTIDIYIGNYSIHHHPSPRFLAADMNMNQLIKNYTKILVFHDLIIRKRNKDVRMGREERIIHELERGLVRSGVGGWFHEIHGEEASEIVRLRSHGLIVFRFCRHQTHLLLCSLTLSYLHQPPKNTVIFSQPSYHYHQKHTHTHICVYVVTFDRRNMLALCSSIS